MKAASGKPPRQGGRAPIAAVAADIEAALQEELRQMAPPALPPVSAEERALHARLEREALLYGCLIVGMDDIGFVDVGLGDGMETLAELGDALLAAQPGLRQPSSFFDGMVRNCRNLQTARMLGETDIAVHVRTPRTADAPPDYAIGSESGGWQTYSGSTHQPVAGTVITKPSVPPYSVRQLIALWLAMAKPHLLAASRQR